MTSVEQQTGEQYECKDRLKDIQHRDSLQLDQIKQIFEIYSAIRNIGSTNPDRTPDTLSNITLNFNVGVVVYLLRV